MHYYMADLVRNESKNYHWLAPKRFEFCNTDCQDGPHTKMMNKNTINYWHKARFTEGIRCKKKKSSAQQKSWYLYVNSYSDLNTLKTWILPYFEFH